MGPSAAPEKGFVLRHGACFGAAERLHRSAEFLRLQRRGTRVQSAHFVMYAGKLDDIPARRLGVTVSRRIGTAVVRNRVKRRVRESFRLTLRNLLPPGASIVVIARDGAGGLPLDVIRTELATSARTADARLRNTAK